MKTNNQLKIETIFRRGFPLLCFVAGYLLCGVYSKVEQVVEQPMRALLICKYVQDNNPDLGPMSVDQCYAIATRVANEKD